MKIFIYFHARYRGKVFLQQLDQVDGTVNRDQRNSSTDDEMFSTISKPHTRPGDLLISHKISLDTQTPFQRLKIVQSLDKFEYQIHRLIIIP